MVSKVFHIFGVVVRLVRLGLGRRVVLFCGKDVSQGTYRVRAKGMHLRDGGRILSEAARERFRRRAGKTESRHAPLSTS